MSIFRCHACDFQRDADIDGCEEYEGNLVCADCYEGLTERDHAWQFCKDTQGDGRDVSFYQCMNQGCDEQRFPEDMPRKLNGGW